LAKNNLYTLLLNCSFLDDASKKRKKPGQDAARFKTDVETGKMVIGKDDEEEEDVNMEDVEGTAYRESMTSADGFTRGSHGRVKFNKDTKKRRREADGGDEDVEMADSQSAHPRKEKRRSESRFGQEFKAKVRVLLFFRLYSPYDLWFNRKLAEMSKREASTRTHTSHCHKRQRKRAERSALASQESVSLRCMSIYGNCILFVARCTKDGSLAFLNQNYLILRRV
jgi:hypothetical protein